MTTTFLSAEEDQRPRKTWVVLLVIFNLRLVYITTKKRRFHGRLAGCMNMIKYYTQILLIFNHAYFSLLKTTQLANPKLSLVYHQFECPVGERCLVRSKNDCVPDHDVVFPRSPTHLWNKKMINATLFVKYFDTIVFKPGLTEILNKSYK